MVGKAAWAWLGCLTSVASEVTVSRHCTVAMLYEPKLIQISTNSCPDGNGCLYALDEDGNVFELIYKKTGYEWILIGSPTADDVG
jgi:hypothetical protein